MTEPLIFMMGKYPAKIPLDYLYCRNHMWCQERGQGIFRFGFSAYAVRLMQDVYFLDWNINEGDSIRYKQQIGNIESSKATSDLFAPCAGQMVSINQELLNDPSKINSDTYQAGWLFEMRCEETSFMNPQQYMEYLATNWESTQRIIKGQL
ncbi:MAG: glycine cleavage system protein H [Gemmataceae bacterium]|jgi:glycine cleavage system H protein|nr:glycine cleavage system protein H [Gemmataceae bacterium]